MREHILQYYNSEKQGSVWGIVLGVIFIAVAVWLGRGAVNASFQRGLCYALLGAGALIVLATGLNVLHNNRRIHQAKERVVTSNIELQKTEVSRMEKVMATAYIGGLTTFSMAAVAGMAMLILSRRPLPKGVGLGLLLFGLLGVGAELWSMKRNR